MVLSLELSKDSIKLGETVEVTYSSTGAGDTLITTDNTVNPIDLGSGDVSGTISFLPTATGSYNIRLSGLGVDNSCEIVNMVCEVN